MCEMSGDELDDIKVSISCDSTSHSQPKEYVCGESFAPKGSGMGSLFWSLGCATEGLIPPASGKAVSSPHSLGIALCRRALCARSRGEQPPSRGIQCLAYPPQLRRPLRLQHPLWDTQELYFNLGLAHKLLPASQGPQPATANPSRGQSGMTAQGPSPVRSGSGTLAPRAQG